MKNRKRNSRRILKKRKRVNLIFVFIILILVIYLTPKMVTSAKYVYKIMHEHYLFSKDFYFNSDKLSLNHTEYEITNNWSGAETYRITINMSSKRNDMAYTGADIYYQVSYTCSDNIECTLSKNNGIIIGTDNGGVNEDSFSVSVNPKNGNILNNGEVAWVEVTATSTSPYEQTITGKLILEVGTADLTYEIIDEENSPYLLVNIINSRSQGINATLSFDPDEVLLDMTGSFYLDSVSNTTEPINGYEYINSITAYIDSLATTSVKFYKVDQTQNYSFFNEDGETAIIDLSY